MIIISYLIHCSDESNKRNGVLLYFSTSKSSNLFYKIVKFTPIVTSIISLDNYAQVFGVTAPVMSLVEDVGEVSEDTMSNITTEGLLFASNESSSNNDQYSVNNHNHVMSPNSKDTVNDSSVSENLTSVETTSDDNELTNVSLDSPPIKAKKTTALLTLENESQELISSSKDHDTLKRKSTRSSLTSIITAASELLDINFDDDRESGVKTNELLNSNQRKNVNRIFLLVSS